MDSLDGTSVYHRTSRRANESPALEACFAETAKQNLTNKAHRYKGKKTANLGVFMTLW